MIFVGNYAHWIKQEWIDYILENKGTGYPGIKEPENATEQAVMEATEKSLAGIQHAYPADKIYFYAFYDEDHQEQLNLTLPIDIYGCHYRWAINKFLPGNTLRMHQDGDLADPKLIDRYWMPMQDYQDGHIFICGGKFMSDYKKGDLFQFEDSTDTHGSCNITYTPRLTFTFIVYRDK
jgi:hypothetical protein